MPAAPNSPTKRSARCLSVHVILAAGLMLAAPGFGSTVSGQVFLDHDGDRILDAGEPGLAGVAVSDGADVVLISDEGRYSLEADGRPFVFVYLPAVYRAHDSFYASAAAVGSVNFGLAEWPESKMESFRFVQISDTHVKIERTGRLLTHLDMPDREDTVQTFIEELNQLNPKPAFVVATSDLVHLGQHAGQFENHSRATEKFTIPLFNLLGNRDVDDVRDPDEAGRKFLRNYPNHLGPDYYSFNFGRSHFVLLNYMRFEEREQKDWIRKDLAAAPKGSSLVFAFHHLPTQPKLKFLAELGVVTVLTGHWHGSRVRESLEVLDLNTPPLRFGGIDRHPRGFRVVEVEGKNVRNELRLGGFKHYAVVVSPQGVCLPASGKIPEVKAYDTRVKIEAIECDIGGRKISLEQRSPWTWMSEVAVAPGAGAEQNVVATVQAVDGTQWTGEGVFRLADSPADSQGSPEFRLKWVAATGGFIAISSPQAGNNGVVVGIDDHGSLKSCGVSAFDQGGKRAWHFATDSAVKNNVAIAGGRVFAASVAGSLYALDEATGSLLWKTGLDDQRTRWEASAPVIANGLVFITGYAYAAAFDEQSGRRVWESRHGIRDFWPSQYPIPLVAQGRVILNTFVAAFALNETDGGLAWKLDGSLGRGLIADDSVIAIRDDFVTAISVADGRIQWTSAERVGDTASRPVVAGDLIVVGTADGRVCGLSRVDGSLRWSFQTGAALASLQPYRRVGSDVNSSPAIWDDRVYIGSSDRSVYALALSTGALLGSFRLGTPIASTPLIRDGTLYIGDYDGNLYAFALKQR